MGTPPFCSWEPRFHTWSFYMSSPTPHTWLQTAPVLAGGLCLINHQQNVERSSQGHQSRNPLLTGCALKFCPPNLRVDQELARSCTTTWKVHYPPWIEGISSPDPGKDLKGEAEECGAHAQILVFVTMLQRCVNQDSAMTSRGRTIIDQRNFSHF